VLCGNLNVRQATMQTSQQVFNVTTICMDTRFQSFSPLINRIVHHAVLNLLQPILTSLCHNLSHLHHAADAVINRGFRS